MLAPADGQHGNSADTAFVTQLLPLVSPTRTHHELLHGRVSRGPVSDSLISPLSGCSEQVFVLADCPSNLRTLNVEMQQF